MNIYVRLGLFLAILSALIEPVAGFVLLGLALTWVLLGLYERL